MPKYNVNRPVKLDGEIVKQGTVECSEKKAKPLLDSGALGTGGAEAGSGGGNDNQVTLEQFSAAVEKLEYGNTDHWTNGGKPEVNALRDVGGVEVTAKERDQLWKQYQAKE